MRHAHKYERGEEHVHDRIAGQEDENAVGVGREPYVIGAQVEFEREFAEPVEHVAVGVAQAHERIA